MRIWSLHPSLLDSKGLVAAWREALLAQKVLEGATKGYINHPQLLRFKQRKFPLKYIGTYLYYLWEEANQRGYNFDKTKIKQTLNLKKHSTMDVTNGQIEYELNHLKRKLKVRDPKLLQKTKAMKEIQLHPLFAEIKGPIEDWEII